MGYLVRIDLDSEFTVVAFENQLVEYQFSQLDQLLPPYTVSVQKRQGSEYPVVVIPLLTQHNIT